MTAEALERKRQQTRDWREENKEYANRYVAIWRRQLKAFVAWLKDGQPCADCHTPHPYYMNDFDHHVGAVKRFNIGTFTGKCGIQTLQAEIMKCDLVCANCHRERTHKRMSALGLTVAEGGA